METLPIAVVAALGYWWSQWGLPILQFVIGLGLVVFVHELGHFLLAKASGIRVDRFALGFGPRLFGIKKGETDYCLCLLPLGGYVMMLGQEDVKRVEPDSDDPRDYRNKSVGTRLKVISAGVVMNVIFASALFVIVGMAGIRFVAPVVGGVQAGYPAAEAEIHWQDTAAQAESAEAQSPADVSIGLAPGDRILRVEDNSLLLWVVGREVTRFDKLPLLAALADRDDQYTILIERVENGRRRLGKATLGVRPMVTARGGERLVFGIAPPVELVFAQPENARTAGLFKAGDRVLAIDGQEMHGYADLLKSLQTLGARPVRFTLQRDGRRVDVTVLPVPLGGKLGDVVELKDGSRLYGRLQETQDDSVILQLPDGQQRRFEPGEVRFTAIGREELVEIAGMIPRLRVAVVEKGTPAEKAGLEPGDVIVGYGDRGAPSLRELFEINRQAVGEGTNITVLRDGRTIGPMWVVPKNQGGRALLGFVAGVDVDHTVLAGVMPGSPAEAAGLAGGDVVKAINGREVGNWLDVFNALKDASGSVRITYRRGAIEATADFGELSAEQFDPADYTFNPLIGAPDFRVMMGPMIRKDPLRALLWGARETLYFVATSYATLNSWIKGNISHKEFTGPVGIAGMAVQVSRRGFIEFVYFLAMISALLAVFNFLPLPVFDGGHAALLLLEKVRGRPLPPRLEYGIQVAGLILICCLFIALTWQDISVYLRNLW